MCKIDLALGEMRILLSGDSGQLARDCREILDAKHSLAGFSKEELDICDRQAVESSLDHFKPDTLLNCAAFTKVDLSETQSNEAMRVNAEGPKILAEECQKRGIRLLHISTDYVFDGRKPIPEPYLESDTTNPLSSYGRSKLAGETAILSTMDNFVILRTAWLYGIGGPNFLKTILKRALQGAKLKIVHDQYGSLTWTRTLAQQIEKILLSDARGIFHASAEGLCTWFDGASYFLKKMGIPAEISPCTTADYPTPAQRPRNSILENRALKGNDLNVMRPWQKDIDDFVERYRDQLIRECRGES